MATTQLLNANVKFDGNILARGTPINKDHAGYEFVKKYLVDADAFVQTNKDDVAIRLITKKAPAPATGEKLPEAEVIQPAAASDPKGDEVVITKKMIIEQLAAKGVEFDERAKRDDLMALLDANGGYVAPEAEAASDPE